MDDFPKKLKKIVRIVLYGPAISQSDCRKPGPYQLPCNNKKYKPWKTIKKCIVTKSLQLFYEGSFIKVSNSISFTLV